MSQIFTPPKDTRSGARRVIDRIVERAIETERTVDETMAKALRTMEQAWKEARQEFWFGAVPPAELLVELGSNASQFFRESYSYAERIHAMGSTLFRSVNESGQDVSRDSNGFLTLALPPLAIRHNQDGTVTIIQ